MNDSRFRLLSLALVLVVLVLSQTGCLVTSSYTKVQRKTEPVQQVQFESDYAQQAFQSQAGNQDDRNDEASEFFFGVPFLLGLSYKSVPSSNAYYNDWVSKVDVNQDGFIADAEVAGLAPPADNSDVVEHELNSGIIQIKLGDSDEPAEFDQ